MEAKKIDEGFCVSKQIDSSEVDAIVAAGFKSIICNRPDGEATGQPRFSEIEERARQRGISAIHLPVASGNITERDVAEFGNAVASLAKPIFAYCATGARCTTLMSLYQGILGHPVAEILDAARAAGFDLRNSTRRIATRGKLPTEHVDAQHDIVIVGGGAAGIAVAASLLSRKFNLDVAIIEPADAHFYQPGWTMVGAGVFDSASTARTMVSLIPRGARWIKESVVALEPEKNVVILSGCQVVKYKKLIIAAGLQLNWNQVEGLSDTLGRNGVTSNYRFDLAPYTWDLVQNLSKGRAVFTQPPMPIKCAGAPQKAMYLSADHWRRSSRSREVSVDFYSAAPVLFGVKDYVPSLMKYVERYDVQLHFQHSLTRVDGPSKRAWFQVAGLDGKKSEVETTFDMLHVVPPQAAPSFIRVSPLADAAGWVDVDKRTLRHKSIPDVYAIGDVTNSPNAKTAAAARKQAPVVAHNVLKDLALIEAMDAMYDGYGSCPLTVEKGKIVLAEFGYDGKLAPSFPWLIDGTEPSRLAWLLKRKLLPFIYWHGMLRGREWLAKPELES